MKLAGWGCFPRVCANVVKPSNENELRQIVKASHLIARGNGRAYGDSAVNKDCTLDMTNFNRFINFDSASGLLVVEAGVLLAEVLSIFVPKGWFPVVTPGTKFVTIGGMLASDVHGKNHHLDGSFGQSIEWFDLMLSDGSIVKCSREKNSDLFNWSIGGMGLTGVVVRVGFYLRKITTSWIVQRTLSAANIEEAIDHFEHGLCSTYSVAWIDCLAKGSQLGRSLVFLGEHAELSDLPHDLLSNPLAEKNRKKFALSFNLPFFFLSPYLIRIFNSFYHWMGKKKPKTKLLDLDSYFYPLDQIKDWNKIYGANGFMQFQCVLPLINSKVGMIELLEEIAMLGSGSFLAVLKRMGKQESNFSFPMEGYTLALDFPLSDENLKLMDRLDKVTLKHKGRFYMTKDSRLSQEVFQKSDPLRYKDFKSFRKKNNMLKFASIQSLRLGL